MDLFFSFKGRVARPVYWLGLAVWAALAAALYIHRQELHHLVALGLAAALVYMALAIAAKRFHDLNQTGGFAVLLLIPFLQVGVAVVLGFIKGTEGSNLYGRDSRNQSGAWLNDYELGAKGLN